MSTIALRLWHGIRTRNVVSVSSYPKAEYIGTYISRYEPHIYATNTQRLEKRIRRVGLIMDMVKGRAAVFSQLVTSPDDLPPTDIVMSRLSEDVEIEEVLEAWNSDPKLEDPPRPEVPCAVLDFCEREPTAEENSRLQTFRLGPPRYPPPPAKPTLEEKQTPSTKHSKARRRNGRKGGRPIEDADRVSDAVDEVIKRLKIAKANGNLKPNVIHTCRIVCKDKRLSIGPFGLRKHVMKKYHRK